MTWCLTGTRPLFVSMMTLCIAKLLAICVIWKLTDPVHLMRDFGISVALAVEMLWSWIEPSKIEYGQWPGVYQASGLCLHIWLPYVYLKKWPLCGNEVTVCVTIRGKLIYPNGLLQDYSISSVLTMKRLSCLAQIHLCSEWAGAWCLTGVRPLFISLMTICVPMKLTM